MLGQPGYSSRSKLLSTGVSDPSSSTSLGNHTAPAAPFPNTTSTILTLRPSPFDQDATLIERANPDYTTTPLFSVSSQKKSKNVDVYRINVGNQQIQPTLVGSSRFSSLSANSEISLPASNQSVKLHANQLDGNGYKFEIPQLGKFGWKSKSGGLMLRNRDTKQELAVYSASAGFGGAGAAKLEIVVPADDYFLDLIVVTWMAAVKMSEKDKQALEIVGELLGGLGGN